MLVGQDPLSEGLTEVEGLDDRVGIAGVAKLQGGGMEGGLLLNMGLCLEAGRMGPREKQN